MKLATIFAAMLMASAFATAAQAADVSETVAYKTWSGPYVGVTAGVSMNKTSDNGFGPYDCDGYTCYSSLDYGFLLDTEQSSASGALGIVGGINWQIDRGVIGLEADYSMVTSSAHHDVTDYPDYSWDGYEASAKTDGLITARVRLGYLVQDNILAYVTGGIAATKVTGTFIDCCDYPEGALLDDSTYAFGWAAGAGVEYRLYDDVTLKGEYLLVSTEGHTAPTNTDEEEAYGLKTITKQGLFRVGVNYLFNGS